VQADEFWCLIILKVRMHCVFEILVQLCNGIGLRKDAVANGTGSEAAF
jgi:hypothetical protein